MALVHPFDHRQDPGMHVPTMLGSLPNVFTVVTRYMNHKMEELDIPSIPEFVEMIADTGAGPQVADIITVGEFYAIAADGGVIFT